jgi:hypothetical protein
MANQQGSQNPGSGTRSNQDPSQQQKTGTGQHSQQGKNDMEERQGDRGSQSGGQHSGSGQQSGGSGSSNR